MEHDRCPADTLRRDDAGLGELVGHHHRRVTEPQLHVHQLATGQRESVAFVGAEGGSVPLGGAMGVSHDDVRCDGVKPLGDRPDVHVGLLVDRAYRG